MLARIYKPARSAMTSGTGNRNQWLLEFEPESPQDIEPLMGWTSSADLRQQVRIAFETREDAIAYAEREGIPYMVFEPSEPKRHRISYADNFRPDRPEPWTH